MHLNNQKLQILAMDNSALPAFATLAARSMKFLFNVVRDGELFNTFHRSEDLRARTERHPSDSRTNEHSHLWIMPERNI